MKFINWFILLIIFLLPLGIKELRDNCFSSSYEDLYLSVRDSSKLSPLKVLRKSYNGNTVDTEKNSDNKYIIQGQFVKEIILKVPLASNIDKIIFSQGNFVKVTSINSKYWNEQREKDIKVIKSKQSLMFAISFMQFLPLLMSFFKFIYLGFVAILLIAIPVVWLSKKISLRKAKLLPFGIFSGTF